MTISSTFSSFLVFIMSQSLIYSRESRARAMSSFIDVNAGMKAARRKTEKSPMHISDSS